MKLKKLAFEFATIFVVALVIGSLVTLLWNFFRQGDSMIDWETTFLFAILFGILSTWTKSRELIKR